MTAQMCECRSPGHKHQSMGKGLKCGATASETVRVGNRDGSYCAACAAYMKSHPWRSGHAVVQS